MQSKVFVPAILGSSGQCFEQLHTNPLLITEAIQGNMEWIENMFPMALLLRKCRMSRTYTSNYTVVHVHFDVVLPISSELDLPFSARCGEQCCWGEGKLIFLNLSVTKFPVGGPTYNLFFPVKLALLVYFCRCTHRKNIPVGY